MLLVDDDWARSLAALSSYDVLLVNPVRDGLNLVAKEGPLLNGVDGVLVLSREAGAWEELSSAGALGVNPFDVVATAEALHGALTMGRRAGPAGGVAAGVGAGADRGRLVGRSGGGGGSGLTAAGGGGFGQLAQQRDGPGGAGHGQIGPLGHLGRALGVDGGDPDGADGGPGRPSWRRPRTRAGRPGRRRTPPPGAAGRASFGRQGSHHRAFVDLQRRAQFELHTTGVDVEAVAACWRSAKGSPRAAPPVRGANAA